MKILVISDVHSNPVALETVWRAECDSDLIVCAGDLVDYGPFPRETIAWLIEHEARCVVGNHDRLVLSCHRSGTALEAIPVTDRKWRDHNGALLTGREAAFLGALPETLDFQVDGFRYLVTHSYVGYELIQSQHAFDDFVRQRFPHVNGHLPVRLVLGHTHRLAMCDLGGGRVWLNPGSTSYRRPDDPTQDANYLTITDGIIELRRLPYDRSPVHGESMRQELAAGQIAAAERFFGPKPTASR